MKHLGILPWAWLRCLNKVTQTYCPIFLNGGWKRWIPWYKVKLTVNKYKHLKKKDRTSKWTKKSWWSKRLMPSKRFQSSPTQFLEEVCQWQGYVWTTIQNNSWPGIFLFMYCITVWKVEIRCCNLCLTANEFRWSLKLKNCWSIGYRCNILPTRTMHH